MAAPLNHPFIVVRLSKSQPCPLLDKGSFVTLTPDIFTPLYTTLVLLHLEYAIQALSPYPKKDIDHSERLQHLGTRMVKGCRDLSHEKRLVKLNLFSLVRRRMRGDVILAYTPTIGSLDLPLGEFFTRPLYASLLGRHSELHHRCFQLNRRKAALTVRIVGPWNRLPAFFCRCSIC